jgi:hypothetical protein
MHYLSLAAMVRNEAPYLEEWVKWHYYAGVEHFYLYENDSTDPTMAIIARLSHDYPITCVQVSGKAIVKSVYESCVKDHSKDSRWIAFLDADEFIVANDNLQRFLKTYEKYPALTVHWYLFGSNGRTIYTTTPVLERYTMREAKVSKVCKSIVDPSRTFECYTSHLFKHDTYPVDEHFVPITTAVARLDKPTCDLIQINHYATKSKEECLKRRAERRLSTGEPHTSALEYFKNHDKNEVEDLKAFNVWKEINAIQR